MSSSLELNQVETKPQSYSLLLKSFADHQQQPQQQQQPDQTQKLEEFLSHLEEEWLKIEAFKRELPLCMQLLSNAMEASRQQLQTYKESQEPKPVLEEFIPLKHSNSEGSDKASNISEKSSWMISAQLWSQSNNEGTKQQTTSKESGQISPKLINLDDDTNKRNVGAFLPFTKERNSCSSPTLGTLPDLALASNDKEIIDEKKCIESENKISCSRRDNNSSKGSDIGGGSSEEHGKTIGSHNETHGASATSQAAHRKARRCWSPDLHRRFVNALQMLGGSQVATPKQIRELMKVDGLTNDEVKSHLQKYRLHTRRPSQIPQSAGTPTPQLVVLGSIWVPPEYATAAHSAGGQATIYGAHPASLPSNHYCAPPGVPQEFYAAAAPPHHHHHHQMHHHHALSHPNQHIYKISSKIHSSPESDIRGTGDRSESIEDGKSESNSWKGDSGENGERRGLASLRDQDDKNNSNNGNEITLKF